MSIRVLLLSLLMAIAGFSISLFEQVNILLALMEQEKCEQKSRNSQTR